MAGHAEVRAFEDDGVHAVDIIVKRRGVARLTRLTDSGDIEAALTVLKDRAEERRARAEAEGADRNCEGVADFEAASGSPG